MEVLFGLPVKKKNRRHKRIIKKEDFMISVNIREKDKLLEFIFQKIRENKNEIECNIQVMDSTSIKLLIKMEAIGLKLIIEEYLPYKK